MTDLCLQILDTTESTTSSIERLHTSDYEMWQAHSQIFASHEVIIEIFSGKREMPVEGTPSDYIQHYQNCCQIKTTLSNFSLDLVGSNIENDDVDEKENDLGYIIIELHLTASDLNLKSIGSLKLNYESIKIKSEFLLFINAGRNVVGVYGTCVYCSGTDLLQGLVHSHSIELTETKPLRKEWS
ncbi:16831_t:CDS:2, partial [Funneliformis mosseae]